MPIEQIVKSICNYKQAYTQYGGLRPFGTAFLFAGWDKNFGFQLYQTDPSGNYSGWKATVIGKHDMSPAARLCDPYLTLLCSLVRRSKQPGRKEHSEDRLLRKQHHQPEPENRREDPDQDDGLHNAQPGTHRVVGAAQRRRRVAGASHTGRCRDPGAAGPNPEGDRRRAEEGRGNHR